MMIKRDGTLAAGAALNPNNLWAGSLYEYLKGPAFVSIGLITPGAAGGLLATCSIGSSVIAEEFLVPFSDPAVRGTDYAMVPEAYLLQGGGVQMDRVVTTLRNPTVGNLAFSGVAMIQPAGGRRR